MNHTRILVIHKQSGISEMRATGHAAATRAQQACDDPVFAPIVAPLLAAHDAHTEAMAHVRKVLKSHRHLRVVWRHNLSGIIPDSFDLVITIGGDGTILHASHAIGRTPILGINSSPATSVGYFTAGDAQQISALLTAFLDGGARTRNCYRMEVRVNGEVVNSRVLNDVLFCHECPASTTRYKLIHDDYQEMQISSGMWIATASGSTAAIHAAGGTVMPHAAKELQYLVREPAISASDKGFLPAQRVRGMVGCDDTFAIQSTIASARLYVDGPHVAIPIRFGDIVTFHGGAAPLTLLVGPAPATPR
jgi:NAD+ kinase